MKLLQRIRDKYDHVLSFEWLSRRLSLLLESRPYLVAGMKLLKLLWKGYCAFFSFDWFERWCSRDKRTKHLPIILAVCGAFGFALWYMTYGDGRGMQGTGDVQGRRGTWHEFWVSILICILAPFVTEWAVKLKKRRWTEKAGRHHG